MTPPDNNSIELTVMHRQSGADTGFQKGGAQGNS